MSPRAGSELAPSATSGRSLDLACDYLVAERRDDRGDEREPIVAFVGDQHAQMCGLAVAHDPSDAPPESSRFNLLY